MEDQVCGSEIKRIVLRGSTMLARYDGQQRGAYVSIVLSVAVGVRYSVIPVAAAAAVTTGMIDESTEAGGR